jgi:hypothetical protein
MKTLTTEKPNKDIKAYKAGSVRIPNALTIKTINDAHNGKGINKPIKNIRSFISSL